MSFDPQERDFIFQAIDDKTRELETFKSTRPRFHHLINLILDEYGLAGRLEEAKQTGQKLQILDLGCSEGLYLHELAQLLQERGWLDAVVLSGLDKDATAIATAHDFARLAKPPHPNVHFYTHDFTRPLHENMEIRQNSPEGFDFIFAILTFMYVPQVEPTFKRLYEQDLKPGGLFYNRELLTTGNSAELGAPHPILLPILKFYTDFVNSLNPGSGVARGTAEWLQILGAEKGQALDHLIRVNGYNAPELAALRNILLMSRNVGQQMVDSHIMSHTEFDQILTTVYRELDRHTLCQLTYVDTLGRKPVQA